MKNAKRGFTLFEVIIALVIIAIANAIIIPSILVAEQRAKENVVETYNNDRKIKYIYKGEEITEEESKNYELENVELIDGTIYMYFTDKE